VALVGVELVHREQFHDGHAEVFQVGDLVDETGESPTPVGGEPTASMREGVLRVRLPKISPPRHVAVVKEGP
ncbi:MAG: hypothetical protein ACHQHM_06305, partial [Thermoanaerobaculales bacterium]